MAQLSRQLADRHAVVGRLEDRCAALSAEVEGLRGSSVTAGHVRWGRVTLLALAIRLLAGRRPADRGLNRI